MKNFLVTIIIPVYNNEQLLKDSLASSINQSYKNLEIIIINDCSQNKKLLISIINQFNDKRVKVIHFDINKGVAASLNYAIKISKGDYICWLSHDDYYHKDKILIQLNYIIQNKIKIIYSNFFLFNDTFIKKINSISLKNNNKNFNKILLKDNINGCTFMIDKIIFEDIGLFQENYKHIQDYDMWVRISQKYQIFHISDYLVYSRVHSNQSSKLFSSDAYNEKELFYLKFINLNSKKLIDFFFNFFYIFSLTYRNYLKLSSLLKKILLKSSFYFKLSIPIIIICYFVGLILSKIKTFWINNINY